MTLRAIRLLKEVDLILAEDTRTSQKLLNHYEIKTSMLSFHMHNEHKKLEEYLILEGELIESDGTVLIKGDFVSYAPGTFHNSRTETGCLLIGRDSNSA